MSADIKDIIGYLFSLAAVAGMAFYVGKVMGREQADDKWIAGLKAAGMSTESIYRIPHGN